MVQRNAGTINTSLYQFSPPGLDLAAVFVNTYDRHIAAFCQLESQTPFAAAVNQAVARFDTRLSNDAGSGRFISRRQRIDCIGGCCSAAINAGIIDSCVKAVLPTALVRLRPIDLAKAAVTVAYTIVILCF